MAESSPNRGSGAPLWVKASGIVVVLLVALAAVVHLDGKGLGGLHHSAASSHTWPSHAPSATHAGHALPSDDTLSAGSVSQRDDAPPDGPTPTREPTSKSSSASAARTAAIAGCWELVVREHPLHGQLSFVANGDSLRGTVTLHDEEHPIRGGTSTGGRFSFKIEMSGTPVQFEGEPNGAELRGTLTRSGERLSWTAQRCK